jgi:hypothetical protein
MKSSICCDTTQFSPLKVNQRFEEPAATIIFG